MNDKKTPYITLLTASFVSVIAFCSVAQAASMSTRVKNLENQVSKQDKTVKQGQAAIKAQDAKIDKGLATVKTLERKVAGMAQQAAVPVEKVTVSTRSANAGGAGSSVEQHNNLATPAAMMQKGGKPPSPKAYTFP
jgi:uncharacterized coiled-coil protein SlyX